MKKTLYLFLDFIMFTCVSDLAAQETALKHQSIAKKKHGKFKTQLELVALIDIVVWLWRQALES